MIVLYNNLTSLAMRSNNIEIQKHELILLGITHSEEQ